MLAYGVVFVLLLGEIDLSIAYVERDRGRDRSRRCSRRAGSTSGIWPIVVAVIAAALIGAFQGSFVAIVGVPSFVVTLAGLLVWQGYVQLQLGDTGPIIIQDKWINYTAQYFFSRTGGWLIAGIDQRSIRRRDVRPGRRRAGTGSRSGNPVGLVLRLIAVPVGAFLVVYICNKDRGVAARRSRDDHLPALLDVLSKRTTFGRHVYAVGGNPEAARRAGISVARIRILVFGISGFMAGVGGIILAARLSSVSPDPGGGHLLLDAISAAVIGGTSLFGGRGEVRSAILGAAVIATIANALFIKQYSNGVIFITTGCILLFAVTLDTLARRRQAKTGR